MSSHRVATTKRARSCVTPDLSDMLALLKTRPGASTDRRQITTAPPVDRTRNCALCCRPRNNDPPRDPGLQKTIREAEAVRTHSRRVALAFALTTATLATAF